MKRTLIPLISLALVLPACGVKKPAKAQQQPAAAEASHEASPKAPNDNLHKMAQGMGGAMGGEHNMAMNTAVKLSEAVRKAWSGIRVKVVEMKTGKAATYDVTIGASQPLGNSGLTLKAESFIPDFVMGDGGITTRSAEPKNPAAQVVISEKGKPDFKGWLFAAMPDIHPFAHEKYRVILVKGIPAK